MLAHYLKVFIISLPIFLIIDFIWLGLVAKKLYDQELSSFERTLNWPAAISVYLVLVLGVVVFSLSRNSSDPWQGFIWAGTFGFLSYGVYDLTNLATLANWSLKITIIDMIWGTILCGTIGYIAIVISNWLK